MARGLARGLYYKLKFRLLRRRVEIGRYFHVVGPLDIRGPGRVIFGDFCSVHSTRLAPTTPYTHSPDAVIRFGDRVRLTGTRFGCSERIEVGNWTGLSDARIMDADFHALEPEDQPRYNTTGSSKPVIIGRNVWVGAGAWVLKGVRIGDDSVVGAAAVVTMNVPRRTVVFGNPARVIWRMRAPQPAEEGGSRAPDPETHIEPGPGRPEHERAER
jgi:acetyltransferase-like isoleucine patch superfamily enzyme